MNTYTRFPFRCAIVAPLLFLIVAPGLAAAQAITGSIAFQGPQGEWVSQGKAWSYSEQTASFAISGHDGAMTITATGKDGNTWRLAFDGPGRERLIPLKDYTNAQRASFNDLSPGLALSGAGRGCNKVFGSFYFDKLESKITREIIVISGKFVQACESAANLALTGTVTLIVPANITLVSTLGFEGDPGDYPSSGYRRYYSNGADPSSVNATFSVYGSKSSISTYVRGADGKSWSVRLQAPTGTTLQPNTDYATTARFATATAAGLDFSGDGRGCNTSSGTLRIFDLRFDASGKPIRLAGQFRQFCSPSVAPNGPSTSGYLEINMPK